LNTRIESLIAEMPEQTQLILLSGLSVLWLKPQQDEARELIARYKERGFDVVALRETALQLFLVAGFQTSLEAAFQIREVYGEGLPKGEEHPQEIGMFELLGRGYHLQAEVYRDNVEKLRENLLNVSPELSEWTVLVGYGLVLSRPGLPGHWRELFEIAVLAAQGFPRQLHSHFRGALHLGATVEEIKLVLKVVELISGPDKTKPAWQMWRRISK